MKRHLHDFIKFNRSTPFIKWLVVVSYILLIFAFIYVLILLYLSDKLMLILAAVFLDVCFHVIVRMSSQLTPWINFGGAEMKNDDYSAAKTEPYNFSKEASAVIERLAKDNGMAPEDYLLTLVRHEALLGSKYISLTEYVNNARQGNDRIAASENILEESKRIKD